MLASSRSTSSSLYYYCYSSSSSGDWANRLTHRILTIIGNVFQDGDIIVVVVVVVILLPGVVGGGDEASGGAAGGEEGVGGGVPHDPGSASAHPHSTHLQLHPLHHQLHRAPLLPLHECARPLLVPHAPHSLGDRTHSLRLLVARLAARLQMGGVHVLHVHVPHVHRRRRIRSSTVRPPQSAIATLTLSTNGRAIAEWLRPNLDAGIRETNRRSQFGLLSKQLGGVYGAPPFGVFRRLLVPCWKSWHY